VTKVSAKKWYSELITAGNETVTIFLTKLSYSLEATPSCWVSDECSYFYMELGFNDFDAGKSITVLWQLKGKGPKISTFFGPNRTRTARYHFRAQKSRFQIPPSNGPRNG
jgi:hypothetical protein